MKCENCGKQLGKDVNCYLCWNKQTKGEENDRTETKDCSDKPRPSQRQD